MGKKNLKNQKGPKKAKQNQKLKDGQFDKKNFSQVLTV